MSSCCHHTRTASTSVRTSDGRAASVFLKNTGLELLEFGFDLFFAIRFLKLSRQRVSVRILAIDQFIDEADGTPRVGKNATIEITPKQAEMLAVVSEIGPISLVLRSLAKDEAELEALANLEDPLAEPDPERGGTYTFDSEVSILASPSSGKSVDVSRGNTVTERRF